MNLEVIIGIEIHCELKTKSKMFSGSPVAFGMEPNTLVNEIDIACPGTLPQLNKKGVELAIRAATALNCEIDHLLEFDRKNYYYSDLPKGYQITQDRKPIGKNGYLDVEVDGDVKRIRIERLHMEEDTAKQTHREDGTLIDYNRSGTPLIEIVTDASIRTGKEAAAYVEKLRQILLFLDVSDVRMDEGSMRCDVNISLRPYGYPSFGPKVEIKNLNSIANVQRAIEFEIMRQEKQVLMNEEIIQETRRFDEASKTTISMRRKEGAVDYKYFCEPNIFPIQLDDEWVKLIQENMPELPEVKQHRYINQYSLPKYDAEVLTQSKELSEYFDELLKSVNDYKLASNTMMSEVLAYLNKEAITIDQLSITPESLSRLINMCADGDISSKHLKQVFELMIKEGKEAEVIVEEKKMKQISDPNALRPIVLTVLKENEQSVQDYLNGRTNLLGFLVGQVLKASHGQANPGLAKQLVEEEISKING